MHVLRFPIRQTQDVCVCVCVCVYIYLSASTLLSNPVTSGISFLFGTNVMFLVDAAEKTTFEAEKSVYPLAKSRTRRLNFAYSAKGLDLLVSIN